MTEGLFLIAGIASLALGVACVALGITHHIGTPGHIGFFGTVLFTICAVKLLQRWSRLRRRRRASAVGR
jgi:hypothetical protein